MKKLFLTFSIALFSMSSILLTSCDKEDPDAISMSDVNENGIIMIQGKDGNEYAVVDLGFPTKELWAVCNIGAESPEQFGTFFSWGETEPKSLYSWDTYKWVNNGEFTDFNKYCTLKSCGGGTFTDNKTVLDKEDDAAKQILGDNWRTPTPSDFKVLVYRCDVKKCKLKGVWGFLFTSKEKGYEKNSLFIPLSGRMDSTNGVSQQYFKSEYGFYWCNTMTNDTRSSYVFWMESKNGQCNAVSSTYLDRYIGLNIRAVTTAQ